MSEREVAKVATQKVGALTVVEVDTDARKRAANFCLVRVTSSKAKLRASVFPLGKNEGLTKLLRMPVLLGSWLVRVREAAGLLGIIIALQFPLLGIPTKRIDCS